MVYAEIEIHIRIAPIMLGIIGANFVRIILEI